MTQATGRASALAVALSFASQALHEADERWREAKDGAPEWPRYGKPTLAVDTNAVTLTLPVTDYTATWEELQWILALAETHEGSATIVAEQARAASVNPLLALVVRWDVED